MIQGKKEVAPWVWGAGVVGLAVIERLLMVAFYAPVAYNDTASYRRLADAIAKGWAGYDGTRTPGYPVFMALVGADQKVYLAQLALGVMMTAAFFYLGYAITRRPLYGALAALAHTLNLGQLFFEADLITENLSTFFIVITSIGAFIWLTYPSRRKLLLALGIGTASALAALTRPLFIYLPVWVALFIALSLKDKVLKIRWLPLFAVLTPALFLIGGWVFYINHNYHMLSLTTMNGYHLVQHTGNFFEYVPDRYAALRDTYLRYRQQRIAQYGTQGNTIWDAIPEMQRVSGLSFYDLSRRLQTISIDLILHHPDLYLKNVVSGWWMFWRAPFYWSPGGIPWAWLRGALQGLVTLERLILFGFNMLFLVASGLVAFWRKFRQSCQLTPFAWLVWSVIWLASIMQTLLDHGDNPRFLVPLQTWVLLWVMLLGFNLVKSGFFRASKHHAFTPSGQ